MRNRTLRIMLVVLLFAALAGCSGTLTTREKGGLIGAGLGAGAGAIIGSTVGHAAVGALVGGPVGLIAGALVGDHLMGREEQQTDQQRTIDINKAEIERLRKENERLKQQRGEW
ncbi:MAG: YMGG-like glycine zipper-containing protein [Candidatus Binatia bacterium]